MSPYFQLTADGDLPVTVDGDLKPGNNQHNALHRVVVRWQMAAPVLSSMFETVLGANEQKLTYEAMIAAPLARKPIDEESVADFLELQEAIGVKHRWPRQRLEWNRCRRKQSLTAPMG